MYNLTTINETYGLNVYSTISGYKLPAMINGKNLREYFRSKATKSLIKALSNMELNQGGNPPIDTTLTPTENQLNYYSGLNIIHGGNQNGTYVNDILLEDIIQWAFKAEKLKALMIIAELRKGNINLVDVKSGIIMGYNDETTVDLLNIQIAKETYRANYNKNVAIDITQKKKTLLLLQETYKAKIEAQDKIIIRQKQQIKALSVIEWTNNKTTHTVDAPSEAAIKVLEDKNNTLQTQCTMTWGEVKNNIKPNGSWTRINSIKVINRLKTLGFTKNKIKIWDDMFGYVTKCQFNRSKWRSNLYSNKFEMVCKDILNDVEHITVEPSSYDEFLTLIRSSSLTIA